MKRFLANNFTVPLIGFVALLFLFNLTPTRDSPKPIGKTLSEYIQMDKDNQRLFVLESRRVLFHSYLNHNDIERASCVAQLFDAKTEQGINQFGKIEALLKSEANRGAYQMADEVTIHFMNTSFCPQNGLLAEEKLINH